MIEMNSIGNKFKFYAVLATIVLGCHSSALKEVARRSPPRKPQSEQLLAIAALSQSQGRSGHAKRLQKLAYNQITPSADPITEEHPEDSLNCQVRTHHVVSSHSEATPTLLRQTSRRNVNEPSTSLDERTFLSSEENEVSEEERNVPFSLKASLSLKDFAERQESLDSNVGLPREQFIHEENTASDRWWDQALPEEGSWQAGPASIVKE